MYLGTYDAGVSPTVGTTAVVAAALRLPVSTVNQYARLGLIARVGTSWPPLYDAEEVALVSAERRAARRQRAAA